MYTSSCARSACFATYARSSLCSSCCRTLNYSVVHVPIQHIIYMMAKLVVKSVTHDQTLQWEQWYPCRRWKATGLYWMCTSRQLYSGVEACCVESAWHEHSFSLWFQSHSRWLSLPGPVWLEYSSPGCQPQSGWHSGLPNLAKACT